MTGKNRMADNFFTKLMNFFAGEGDLCNRYL